MHSRNIASVAALLAACAPVTAWAQRCPSDSHRPGSETPPLPTVVSYAVTRSTGPVSEREREAHEAVVIGGHAVDGEVRIDIRLSADVPSDCDVIVDIIDPAISDDLRARTGRTGSVARALAKPVHNFQTDGTNRLVASFKTLATSRETTDAMAFTIGNWNSITRPTRHPFAVRRSAFGDMTMTMSASSGIIGTPIMVTATTVAGFDREAFTEAVVFQVEPPSAGTFSSQAQFETQAEVNAQSATRNAPGRGEAEVNFAFAPPRAQNNFRPAQVTSPVNATITTSVAGWRRTMAFTVLPVPVACKLVGEYKRVPDGIELTITNTDNRVCPAYRAEMRRMQSATTETREIPSLAPTRATAARTPIDLRAVAPRAGSLGAMAISSTISSSWTGTFRLSDVNLLAGTVIVTRLIPRTADEVAVDLGAFTVPSPRGTIPLRN